MVFGRYLKQRRKSRRVRLDAVSYLLGDVLVDEQNGNVLALAGELVEGGLDGCVVRLCVNDEEVLLAVGRLCDVLCGLFSICLWGVLVYCRGGQSYAYTRE
jgi:hypothetical protein